MTAISVTDRTAIDAAATYATDEPVFIVTRSARAATPRAPPFSNDDFATAPEKGHRALNVESRQGEKPGAITAVIGLIITVGSSAAIAAVGLNQEALADAHQVEVQEWLANNYGIDVPQDSVGFLLSGETVSVTYDGEPTRVVLTRDSDDRVDFYGAAGDHLTPLK